MKPQENEQNLKPLSPVLAVACIAAGGIAWSYCSMKVAYAQNGRGNALVTSICELVDRPEFYDKKIVVVEAEFHATIDSATLNDANCPSAGVVPESQIDRAHDPLLVALSHGCMGTLDKVILATWIGEYRLRKKSELKPGEFPRLLYVTKVENFSVRRIPGAPDCGRP